MKTLITGSGGFLGKYVLAELKKNSNSITPILLSSKSPCSFKFIDSKGYSFDESYLTANGCGDVEALIHMGAFTPKSSADTNNISGCTSNISNTLTLISSRLPALKKVIYISTLDVYGKTSEVITESSPCNPSTLYGISKLYCEKMVSSFCAEHNITIQILRIGHIYGPGEEIYKKVMPVMIENALKNTPISIFGDGSVKRTYIYAADVAKAILAAMSLDSSNTVNIVGDRAVSLKELAEIIVGLANSRSEIKYLPAKSTDYDSLFNPEKMKILLISNLVPLKTGLAEEISSIASAVLS